MVLTSGIAKGEVNRAATGELTDADFSERLIALLRRELHVPSLTYAEPPVRLTGGFDTLIHRFTLNTPPNGWSGPLVVRLYRDAEGPARARFERVVQVVISAQGFPAPRPILSHDEVGRVGGAFIIMPCIPGRTMMAAMMGPEIFRSIAALAAMHVALHALDPAALVESLESAGCPLESLDSSRLLEWLRSEIGRAGLHALVPGLEWLERSRPIERSRVICHGDFHPLNILVKRGKVTGVVDWSAGFVRISEPEYDVGATSALIALGPVDLPGPLMPFANAARRWIVSRYLRAYAQQRPLDPERLRYYEALRLLAFLTEAGVSAAARSGAIEPTLLSDPFGAPPLQRRIRHRFAELTAIGLGH